MTLNEEAIKGHHMLTTSWTFWYDDPSNEKLPYGLHLHQIYSFQSVENFWKLYNNIIHASDLHISSTYALFRKGIEPKWEDPQNQNGGRWIHYCNNIINDEKKKIEEKWINTMLACIGEDFPQSENVKGCIFNVKKNQMRISLWINCELEKKSIKMIGSRFKSILELTNEKIIFHYHQSSQISQFSQIDSQMYYNLMTL